MQHLGQRGFLWGKQMPKAEAILQLELGDQNGTLSFFSVEEIRKFVEVERGFWTWLSAPPVSGGLNGPWSAIANGLTAISNAASAMTNDNLANMPAVRAAFDAFRTSKIPLSNSPIGAFVEAQRQEQPIVAAAALASWMNVGGTNLARFDHLKGAVLMAAFDANITTKAPVAVKRSLEQLHQQFQHSRSVTETETREQREQFAQEKQRQQSALAKMIWQGRNNIKAFKEEKSRDIEGAITSIRATEELYRQQMKIKGPVEYWSTKAESHRVKATAYRTLLVRFSAIGALVLITALWVLASHAIEIASSAKPPAVYLVLVTLGVVVTTIVFWAARILTRLFLSEHHLSIDAEERSVMAQTYLALTAEGQASDKEREIVLASLFRPTADGIVKDDAAPDLSPASLLSKIASR
jgi:hypothetical protein